MSENDIKRIFYDDSREKKRTAIGIHKRASRRGYIRGGIRTAYDFMTKKERNKLNGEVKIYNMYDNYKNIEKCDLNEILKKNENEVKNILSIIKENNTCNVICTKFKISNGKLYNLYKKYGVEYDKGRNKYKKDISNIDFSKVLISKQKFNLMDGIQKGEYITNIISQYDLTLTQVAEFMESKKSNISYYIKIYNKKKIREKEIQGNDIQEKNEIIAEDIKIDENKTQIKKVEVKEQSKENEIIVMQPEEIPAENEDDFIVEPEIIESEKDIMLQKRIEELENMNKNLTNQLLSLTTNKNTKLKIEINGQYKKEELSNRLLSLNNMIMEDNKYNIKLILEEI